MFISSAVRYLGALKRRGVCYNVAVHYSNHSRYIPAPKFSLVQHNFKTLSSQTTIGRIKPAISIIFTCNVCNKRQAKTMSKKSYQEGVVLIRCGGCENIHLIADNMGWFNDDKTNIVDILKEKNELVQTLSDTDLLDVTDLDLIKEDVKPS